MSYKLNKIQICCLECKIAVKTHFNSFKCINMTNMMTIKQYDMSLECALCNVDKELDICIKLCISQHNRTPHLLKPLSFTVKEKIGIILINKSDHMKETM